MAVDEIALARDAVDRARRGGGPRVDVINTSPRDRLLRWLAGKRRPS